MIFVVDSDDRERMLECKEELWRFLEEEELKDAVVLIMTNKQDLPDAMSPSEIAEALDVHKVQDRSIRKFFCFCFSFVHSSYMYI